MLPYYPIPPLHLGPLTAYPFGFLVAVGIMVGISLAEKRCAIFGLKQEVLAGAVRWALICGFIGAHLYSAIFYFPEQVKENPLYLLKFWDGISSFGGFMGGSLGVVIYFYRTKQNFWAYGDCISYGFAFAWIFGRLGCTVAFDHPGNLTHFFLAMPYPVFAGAEVEPGIRHNLGFYEFLWALCVSALFYSQRLKTKFSGWYLTVFVVAYMPLRFFLDFMRAEDKRYFGLTAGQYGAVLLFAFGIWVWTTRAKVNQRLVPVRKQQY